jgi:hypothetical protein
LSPNIPREAVKALDREAVAPIWHRVAGCLRAAGSIEDELGKVGGGAGSRIPPGDVGFDRSRLVSDGSPVGDGEDVVSPSSISIGVDPFARRKVENGPNVVRDRLFTALAQWTMAPDARALRRALLEILSALE